MATVKQQMDKMLKQMDKLYAKQELLKSQCTHEGLLGEYGANTGNYCSSDNSYWVNFKCPQCDKCWREDQDKQQYKQGNHYTEQGFIWTKGDNK